MAAGAGYRVDALLSWLNLLIWSENHLGPNDPSLHTSPASLEEVYQLCRHIDSPLGPLPPSPPARALSSFYSLTVPTKPAPAGRSGPDQSDTSSRFCRQGQILRGPSSPPHTAAWAPQDKMSLGLSGIWPVSLTSYMLYMTPCPHSNLTLSPELWRTPLPVSPPLPTTILYLPRC